MSEAKNNIGKSYPHPALTTCILVATNSSNKFLSRLVSFKIFMEETLKDVQTVAIVLPRALTDEIVGAALALFLFFEKEKKSAVVFSEMPIPPVWKCLDSSPLLNQVPRSARSIIRINTAQNPIQEVSYEKNENEKNLSIIITSKNGGLTKNDLFIEHEKLKIDSVITVGAKNVASVGSVWKERPDLFYERPIVAIDNDLGTGQTIPEKTVALIKKISDTPYTPQIATALLFSLYAATGSLKKETASPPSLVLASELLTHKADHQMIAETFTENVPLEYLQLWGRACVRSKIEKEKPLFWSFVTADDFIKTGAPHEALSFVFKRMGEVFSLPTISVFLWQNVSTKKIHSYIVSAKRKLSPALGIKEEYPSFYEAEEHIRRLLHQIV